MGNKTFAVVLTIALSGIAAFLCWFYFPFIAGQSNFFHSDISYYFEPLIEFVAGGIRKGHFPLWNPYLYCGMAQIAVLSPSLFYPPSILFVFLPFSVALACYLIFHQMAAAVSAAFLARNLGYGWAGSFILAVSYSLSAYFFTALANFSLIATATWLPLMFFALRSISVKKPPLQLLFYCLLLALSVFLTISAGRPEVWLASLTLGAGSILCGVVRQWLQTKDLDAVKTFACRVAAMGSGLMLAAPVLLPVFEWARLSTRAHGMKLQFVLTWSANWYDWISLVLLPPLGDLSYVNNPFYYSVGARPGALPFLGTAYVGPVVLTLAIFAMLDRSFKWRWFVVSGLVLFCLICAGNNTPVASFIVNQLPFLSVLRYPVKLMVLPAFILCLLAARGAHQAVEKNVPYWQMAILALTWSVIAGVGLYLDMDDQINTFFSTLPTPGAPNIKTLVEMQMLFAKSFEGSALLSIACLLVCAMHRAGFGNRNIIATALVSEVFLTMVVGAVRFTPHGAPADYFNKPAPLAEKLRSLQLPNNGFNISSRSITLYNDPLYYQIIETDDLLTMEVKLFNYSRCVLYPNEGLDFELPVANGYEAANKDAYSQMLTKVTYHSQLCPEVFVNAIDARDSDKPLALFLANAATPYVVCQSRITTTRTAVLDPAYFDTASVLPDINITIFHAKQCHPRAYFAQKIEPVRDGWRAFVVDMLDKHAKADFSKTCVEISPEDTQTLENFEPTAASEASQAIRCTEDSFENVKLEVSSPSKSRNSLLVLADAFYPGWTAQIDGKDTKIFKINGFFRGVFVPPGTHSITFRYQPISFYAGLLICACTGLVYLSLLVFFWLKRKK